MVNKVIRWNDPECLSFSPTPIIWSFCIWSKQEVKWINTMRKMRFLMKKKKKVPANFTCECFLYLWSSLGLLFHPSHNFLNPESIMLKGLRDHSPFFFDNNEYRRQFWLWLACMLSFTHMYTRRHWNHFQSPTQSLLKTMGKFLHLS